MKNRIIKILAFTLSSLCLLFCTACCKSEKMEYYAEKSNYVAVAGTVTHLSYNEDYSVLYFGFSDLNPECEDNSLKIVGDNLLIVQQNGIDQKVTIGDRICFITAPRCFGDGYVMPIVRLSTKDKELLAFDEEFVNLQKWLKHN